MNMKEFRKAKSKQVKSNCVECGAGIFSRKTDVLGIEYDNKHCANCLIYSEIMKVKLT